MLLEDRFLGHYFACAAVQNPFYAVFFEAQVPRKSGAVLEGGLKR